MSGPIWMTHVDPTMYFGMLVKTIKIGGKKCYDVFVTIMFGFDVQ